MKLRLKFLIIFIGIFFTYIFFFPVNYTINQKKLEELSKKNLENIYKFYNIHYEKLLFNEDLSTESNECYLYLVENVEIFRQKNEKCQLFFPVHNSLNFEGYLDFLYIHYLFLKNKNYKVIIVSENQYNTLSLFLGIRNSEIKQIVLNEKINFSIPLIWKIIEPRVCFIFYPKEKCVEFQIYKFVHRKEIYERIYSPILWVLNKNILKGEIKQSFEIFHQLGLKSERFIPKEIKIQ